MQNIINILKSAIKNPIDNFGSKLGAWLRSIHPKTVSEVIAVYHVVVTFVNIGCGIAVLIFPSNIIGILAILGVNLLIAYILILIHGGCPLTPIENFYRARANLHPIKFTPRYAYNLIISLLRRLIGM